MTMTPQHIDTDRTPPPPPRESTPPLGALIRHHRTRIGLTQRELADLSTISVRAIRDLEQNRVRRPRGETVQLIADGLRLGPRSREALSSAARRCRAGTADEGGPPAPPATLHPIIGRDRETEVITAELAGGAERLLHLTGFSGTGKTRLAVEAATRLHRQQRMPVLWYTFPGSGDDCLVPCDPAVNGLPHRWVRWLFGPVADGGGAGVVPDDGPGPALREQLGDQPALLVIDGAPSRPAHPGRLTALLRGHPGLQLLVTSGEPWELPGERTFLLTGLDTDADDGPAGRLFWEQARRTRPELPASDASRAQAAEICRRLDGIPRALLAAASWLAVCDLPTLHRRLTEDPRPFLDQLAGPEHAGHYLDTLRDRLLRLRDDRRALLTALSVAADDGGEFSLDQVVTLTARPLAHCARTLRDLLLTGAVRQVSGPSGARFRVLGLVRAVLHDLAGSPAAVPAARAAAPAAVPPNCSRSAAPTAASRTPLRVG